VAFFFFAPALLRSPGGDTAVSAGLILELLAIRTIGQFPSHEPTSRFWNRLGKLLVREDSAVRNSIAIRG